MSNPDITQEEIMAIYPKVAEIIADALGCDEEDVKPDSSLINDLDAESIDFLDIVFRLEKNFDIKIPRGELFPENLAGADSGFIEDGVVTEKGIAELRDRMPHADIDSFADDPKVENIQELFTVEMICKFLESKING